MLVLCFCQSYKSWTHRNILVLFPGCLLSRGLHILQIGDLVVSEVFEISYGHVVLHLVPLNFFGGLSLAELALPLFGEGATDKRLVHLLIGVKLVYVIG